MRARLEPEIPELTHDTIVQIHRDLVDGILNKSRKQLKKKWGITLDNIPYVTNTGNMHTASSKELILKKFINYVQNLYEKKFLRDHPMCDGFDDRYDIWLDAVYESEDMISNMIKELAKIGRIRYIEIP